MPYHHIACWHMAHCGFPFPMRGSAVISTERISLPALASEKTSWELHYEEVVFHLSTVGESHLYWTLLVPQVPLLYWAAILQLLWPLTAKGPQLQRFWRICFTQEAVPCLVACSQWLSDVVWKASLWPPSRRCSRQNLLCGVLFMFQSSCRVRLTLDHN